MSVDLIHISHGILLIIEIAEGTPGKKINVALGYNIV